MIISSRSYLICLLYHRMVYIMMYLRRLVLWQNKYGMVPVITRNKKVENEQGL